MITTLITQLDWPDWPRCHHKWSTTSVLLVVYSSSFRVLILVVVVMVLPVRTSNNWVREKESRKSWRREYYREERETNVHIILDGRVVCHVLVMHLQSAGWRLEVAGCRAEGWGKSHSVCCVCELEWVWLGRSVARSIHSPLIHLKPSDRSKTKEWEGKKRQAIS